MPRESTTAPAWLIADPLACALINDVLAPDAAFVVSERVAIIRADDAASETAAILSATGGYIPVRYVPPSPRPLARKHP